MADLIGHLERGGFQAEAGGFGEGEQEVHVLHGLAGGAFEEVVDDGGDDELAVMHLQGDQALVCVDHLLEVHGAREDVREGRIGIEVFIQGCHFLQGEGARGLCDGEDAAGEIAPDRDEVQIVADAQVPADFRQVLVRQDFIGRQVVVPPAEVRRGSGLDAGAGGTGDGLDMDIAPEEAGLRQRQERQLDGGREAAGLATFSAPAIRLRFSSGSPYT